MKRVPSLIIAIRGAYAPRYWYVAPAGLRYFRDLAAAWLKFVTQALRFCETHRNLPAAIEIAPAGASESASRSKLSRSAAQCLQDILTYRPAEGADITPTAQLEAHVPQRTKEQIQLAIQVKSASRFHGICLYLAVG